ncbi:MAG: hypothetical protein H7Y86_13090 [Rhizobacter sp.]|nr:hypothetical protein [Ferruginibacter sp.]
MIAPAQAQVGVGTTVPHTSAALPISAAAKGLLPARMSYAPIKAIANRAAGLVLYDIAAKATGKEGGLVVSRNLPSAHPGRYLSNSA